MRAPITHQPLGHIHTRGFFFRTSTTGNRQAHTARREEVGGGHRSWLHAGQDTGKVERPADCGRRCGLLTVGVGVD